MRKLPSGLNRFETPFGIDDWRAGPGSVATIVNGTQTIRFNGDTIIGPQDEYNITATVATTLVPAASQHDVLTNYGTIRGEAPSQNSATAFSIETISGGTGDLVNHGLIQAHAGAGSYQAIGANGVNGAIFNHGTIRAVAEGVNAINYAQATGAGAVRIVNSGTIEAISTLEAWATALGMGGVLENSGTIYAEGSKRFNVPGVVGVWGTQSAGVTVINSGTIQAVSRDAAHDSFGLAFFRDSTNHYAFARVVNSGTIIADVAVLGYATSAGGITGIHVVNSGIVQGDWDMDLGMNILDNRTGGSWTGAVKGGVNEDAVRNAGLIQGNVTLGAEDDLFDGRGGVQNGLVDGGSGFDALFGGSSGDSLSGGGGRDLIVGGGGADSLTGGAEGDVFAYLAAGDSTAAAFDTIADFQAGVDRLDLSALAPSSVSLAASGGFTIVTAQTAAGTVTIRVGGSISLADIVTAPAGATVTGTAAGEILFSAVSGAQLFGLGGDDVLQGAAGADSLDGGAGVDLMRGGAGDDIYYADDYGDRIVEFEGEGNDELRSTASQRLQANVETLTLLGSAEIFGTGNPFANTIAGNGARNELRGEGGDDVLIGGGGADILLGGDGNDRYVYLAASDSVAGARDSIGLITSEDAIDLRAVSPLSISWQETMGGYWQNYAISNLVTVQTASGTMTILTDGKLFRSDFLTGSEIVGGSGGDDLAGTGNDDVILGGAGGDRLSGLSGRDTLSGQAGNDLLDGGAGADTMTGGAGDDIYLVDDAGDYVWETYQAGDDSVVTSVSYALADLTWIETLRTSDENGTGAINLTGNRLNNIIYGNAGANVIDGGFGTDPTAFVTGGIDILVGFGGDDTYFVDDAIDLVREEIGGGHDIVMTRSSHTLAAGSEVEVLALVDNHYGSFTTVLIGNEFGQRIIGNHGRTEMDGKGGADVFVYLSAAHSTQQAMDRIRAFETGVDKIDLRAVSPGQIGWIQQTDSSDGSLYQLVTVQTGAGQMSIRVDGPLAMSDFLIAFEPDQQLSGTSGDDVLTGAGGNDTLDGLGGADSMSGGLGDDSYFVDHVGDVVIESAGGGYDIVYAGVSYALAADSFVEVLATIDNTAATPLNLIGNALANYVTGNAGANLLDGGAGPDQLWGRGGDDSYYADAGDDVVEYDGDGYDILYARSSYALGVGQSIEVLATIDNTATTAINLTGNAFDSYIVGNAGANTLDGGGGSDILWGREGDDSYFADGNDVVLEYAGQGNDILYAQVSYVLADDLSIETLATADNMATTAINLTGNSLDNYVTGNAGANILDGGAGADLLWGRAGDDSYFADGNDTVVEHAGQGNDIVYARSSFVLGAGMSVEILATVDNTASTALNLTGNELNNYITGNAGANILDGGSGADQLYGRGGADSFAFTTALGGGNVDHILDFVSGTDRIALDDAVFAGIGTSGSFNANAFFAGTAAHDTDDRILYDQASGQLFYDADGSGVGAALLFAIVSPGTALSASDFMVI